MIKIAIPTKDGKRLSSHFGGHSDYKIFEIRKGKITDRYVRKNILESDINHYSDKYRNLSKLTSHSNIINQLEDCHVVITRRMGRHIWDEFGHLGVEVIFTKKMDVDQNVNNYLSNEYLGKFKMHH